MDGKRTPTRTIAIKNPSRESRRICRAETSCRYQETSSRRHRREASFLVHFLGTAGRWKDDACANLRKGSHKALDDVHKYGNLPVPMKIRNAPTKLMKDLGYHKGYEKYTKEDLLPEKLKARKYM